MAIVKKDRFFGEGISSYGEGSAQEAFNIHRQKIRTQRLADAIGADTLLSNHQVEEYFERIKLAIESADAQAEADNAEFIKEYSIQL